MLYLISLADKKIKSDWGVLREHPENTSLYDSTLKHAEVSNHFGLTEKKNEPLLTPI